MSESAMCVLPWNALARRSSSLPNSARVMTSEKVCCPKQCTRGSMAMDDAMVTVDGSKPGRARLGMLETRPHAGKF